MEAEAPRLLEAGTLLAERYRVEALLGEGGMGAVYRVSHVHMHKTFALKLLHPMFTASPEVLARFEREAVAAAKIDHPNVAHATDFGRLPDGGFFLVLEHVSGKSLRELLAEGPIPPERVFAIARQILHAVGAAHAKGIVHRDLKPENVMLSERNGESDFVKVLDFGIAKVSDDTDGPAAKPLTRMGAVMGTPDYMAPEQAMGRPVDHRADLYAIGVMLYEMLSGARPFQGGMVTVMRQHIVDDVPPLPEHVLAKIDPRAQGLLRELLAKSPESRPESAVEVATRIAELAAAPAVSPSPPIAASTAIAPPTQTEGAPLGTPRRSPIRIVLAALAVVAGFVVFGLIVALVFSGGARAPDRTARTEARGATAKQAGSAVRAPSTAPGTGSSSAGKPPEKKCNTRLPLIGCVD